MKIQNKELGSVNKDRKVFLFILFIVALVVFYAVTLVRMQIVQGDNYKTLSRTNSIKVTEVSAERGEIYDRNANTPLVINSDSFAVVVTPGQIPSDKFDSTMIRLANYLGISKEQIDNKIPKKERKSYSSYQIKSNVPFSVISNIAENKIDLPGVSWISKPIRSYLHTQSLSHIVGYVGDITKEDLTVLYNQGYNSNSVIGKTGIEKQYDSKLQGKPGREITTRDTHGRTISEKTINEPPKSGNNLVLTIDSDIQKLAEEALGNRVGSVVVLKPATGEVLAMVSYPYFDSNIFNSDNSSREFAKLVSDNTKPLTNRAVQFTYPPASTFKIIMSTAMLQERAFPAGKKIECTGEMEYGGRVFHCHLHSGHGWLDMKNGMAQSCDVYYWTIGRDYLGIDKIASYAKEFGFGRKTNIDLPDEKLGLVPDPEWKLKDRNENWVGGDTMSVSIGQGFTGATPLQMADMVAMVANEGKIYTPHLLKEVRDPATGEVIEEVKPKILTESTIDKSVWKQVQEAMRYTVTDGTPVYPMHNKTVKIACKTGTAEVDGYKNSWHSWLVAYAPYDAPPEERVCVATVVEACNTWEWWAPYCTNIIIQGIFNKQTYDESITELGFKYLVQSNSRME